MSQSGRILQRCFIGPSVLQPAGTGTGKRPPDLSRPCRPVVRARLAGECNYGEYEGKIADAMPDDPVVRQWNTAPGDTVFPGGDAIRSHADRAHAAFLIFCRELPPDCRVVCVTHRTTIRLLVACIMGLDLNRFRDVPCSNCGITEIRVDERDTPRIHALNVTPGYTGQSPFGGE
jgi:broad specificity phosphatase PhoE